MSSLRNKKTEEKGLMTSSAGQSSDYSLWGVERKGWWPWVKIALILVATFALYIQTRNFDFVLDDKLVYSENTYVQKGIKGIGQIVTEDSFAGYFQGQRNLVEGARYRPLSLVTFAIEKSLWGGGPAGAHVVNLLLYLLSLAILYCVLWVLLPQYNRYPLSVADIGTVFFALHPIHTEVVANVKGRDEIMAVLFSLLVLLYLYHYVKTQKPEYLLCALFSFSLGLLSKENTIALLVLGPLAMWYFVGISFRKMGRLMATFLMVAVAYLAWRYWVVGWSMGSNLEFESVMNNPFLGMRADEKWATIVYTLGLYLKLLIIPHPLTHDYYPYHIPIMHLTDATVWAGLLTYMALAYFAIRGFQRKGVYSYAVLFYLGGLFIVSNIPFTVGTFMNERFLYLPSFGFALWVGWAAARLLYGGHKGQGRIALAILLITVLGYVGQDLRRIPDWKTGFTLNASAARVSVNSARINLFMGVSYFNQAKAERGETKRSHLEIADHYLSKATRILPDYFEAWKMKSGVLAEQFQMDGDIDHLLRGFADISVHKPGIPYIDEYLKYLKNLVRYNGPLLQFFDDLGYERLFKASGIYDYALHYLSMGEELARSPEYYLHLAEVCEAFARDQEKQTTPRYAPEVLYQQSTLYRKKALSLSSD